MRQTIGYEMWSSNRDETCHITEVDLSLVFEQMGDGSGPSSTGWCCIGRENEVENRVAIKKNEMEMENLKIESPVWIWRLEEFYMLEEKCRA